MKENAILILLIILLFDASAQNLVPNPSFELYNNCPIGMGDISYSPTHSSFPGVKDWTNPHKVATPDYFNTCASIVSGVNLPNNYVATKSARTGSAAVGLYVLANNLATESKYSENIQCKLSQKLKTGVKYEVSFYVCYANSTGLNMLHDLVAVDKIGVSIDNFAIADTSSSKLYLTESYEVVNKSGNFLTDSINWTKIRGYYIAKGGEQYLTIGYFDDGYPQNYTLVSSGPGLSPTMRAYYFVDDVSLTEAIVCDTIFKTKDTIICNFEPYNLQLSSTKNSAAYTWSNGSTAQHINVDSAGIFWCEAKTGCNLTVDTFKIKPALNHSGNIKDTLVCEGVFFDLKADKSDKYKWNTGDSTQIVTKNEKGIYICQRLKNCNIEVDSYRVAFHSFSIPELGNDTTICNGDLYILGTQLPFVRYMWNTGDTTCCINVLRDGNYNLTTYNTCLSYSDSVSIGFTQCDNCFFIPNAFTPNGDGKNDLFGCISQCEFGSFSISIFNRWGEQIFVANNIFDKWRGDYRGAYAEMGTYYYLIKYKVLKRQESEIAKGSFILIR